MIGTDTVLILGAGASVDYGYPTGEVLVDRIKQRAIRLAQHCRRRLQTRAILQFAPAFVETRGFSRNDFAAAANAWQRAAAECDELAGRLDAVQPIVIDYFLEWNPDIREIGKLLIALEILSCEGIDAHRIDRQPGDFFRPNRCYRFLAHAILDKCKSDEDLLKNKIRFVTFNYDCSLEYYLRESLLKNSMLTEEGVSNFLNIDRIVHVYGSVRAGVSSLNEVISQDAIGSIERAFPDAADPSLYFLPVQKLLDASWMAAQQIRTIQHVDKSEEKENIISARRWINEAAKLYILGFGFDKTNSNLVGISDSFSEARRNHVTKSAYFTNYKNKSVITKRAEELFFGFRIRSDLVFSNMKSFDTISSECSENEIYQALADDLDSIGD